VRLASAYSTSVPKGDVVSESPAPGTSAAYGSTVTVTVSLGPPDVAAPDLVGDTFAQAESALSDVGLTYGSLTTPGGLSLNGVAQYLGSNVVVVGQSVVPGSEVPVGSAINLVLAPGS
jgi:beta-lactam-binding protein with PASTA domain